MIPRDELSELWLSQPDPGGDAAALLREVERRMRPFDRCIRRRDWREQAAGAFVTSLFGWFAFHAHDSWTLAADLWMCAYGLWVIFYLRMNSRALRDAPHDCSLAEYRAIVLDRYEQQIRILQQAKYWYVTPFWIGMMLVTWGAYRRTGSLAVLLADGLAFTFTSAVLWWANEGPGVRMVRRKLRDILALFGSEGEE